MVELPVGMPKDVFGDLRKVWVCGQQLRISRDGEAPGAPVKDGRPPRSEAKPRRKGPPIDGFKPEKKRAPKAKSKANSAEARPGSSEAKRKPSKRAPTPADELSASATRLFARPPQ